MNLKYNLKFGMLLTRMVYTL